MLVVLSDTHLSDGTTGRMAPLGTRGFFGKASCRTLPARVEIMFKDGSIRTMPATLEPDEHNFWIYRKA
jgi:hypothetical protein